MLFIFNRFKNTDYLKYDEVYLRPIANIDIVYILTAL